MSRRFCDAPNFGPLPHAPPIDVSWKPARSDPPPPRAPQLFLTQGPGRLCACAGRLGGRPNQKAPAAEVLTSTNNGGEPEERPVTRAELRTLLSQHATLTAQVWATPHGRSIAPMKRIGARRQRGGTPTLSERRICRVRTCSTRRQLLGGPHTSQGTHTQFSPSAAGRIASSSST